jgi:dihydrofolate reductase
MGRTAYWMNVSLDLRIERAPNEQGGGAWMRIGRQLHEEINVRARELALSIEGRVIYETMESFWPAAVDDETMPDYIREYGRIWTSAPKVLVSNTRTEAQHDTRIIGGDDVMGQIAELRATADGTIGVGGATVATQLLQHGLLDELMLFTHPTVLGTGRPRFDELAEPLECDLLEHKEFEDGVILHRYSIRGAQPR